MSFFACTCIGRHLGAAAVLLGYRAQARRYYAQVLDIATKVGFRPEIALTRLGMAELCLEEAGPNPRPPSLAGKGETVPPPR